VQAFLKRKQKSAPATFAFGKGAGVFRSGNMGNIRLKNGVEDISLKREIYRSSKKGRADDGNRDEVGGRTPKKKEDFINVRYKKG